MANQGVTESDLKAQLQQEFDREVDRLALSAERTGIVEAVFRLRALLELSEMLSTAALLQLVYFVVEGERARQDEPRSWAPTAQ